MTSRLSRILDQTTVISSVDHPGGVTEKTITIIIFVLALRLKSVDTYCSILCSDFESTKTRTVLF